MANITEVSQWENVIRQIENGEAATGGADGLANMQAKQLANRTQWLKGNLAPIVNAAFSGTLKHGNNDLAGSGIVAKSMIGTGGYIKYASGLIIQFGHYSNVPSTETVITYPISMPAFQSISIEQIDDGLVGSKSIVCGKLNESGFTVKVVQGGISSIRWLAIGY